MSNEFYLGYDVLKFQHRGPVVRRAKYRLRMPRFICTGRSQSHVRKLQKQWAKQ